MPRRRHRGPHGPHGPGGPWGPPREVWRRWYFHWRLRRRIFSWMAVAMLVSGVAVGWVFRWSSDHGHVHGIKPLLLPLALTFFVLWAAAGAIAHRLAHPFVELERVARAIGAGDLHARFSLARTSKESRVIGETINDMADRIEKQLADQRALLAAVSHEIRTPLARMRLLVELGKADGRDAGPLDEIDREIVDIDTLVGELLAASRIDFSAVDPRDLDLRELATQAVARAGVDAERLVVVGEPEARGDATLVVRAMGNLLENAKRHGEGVSKVTLGVRDGRVFFEVDDTGKGFAPGEEARAFEAFRKGRGRDETTTGTGFGLALVRRIAEAHGGRAYAKNLEPSGARVGFELAR
jgi:two-component system OmpR family sensor kinase